MMVRLCCFLFLILGAGRCVGQMDDRSTARFRVSISSGYEREDLRWSIAGNSAGQDPNIYSELKWHGVSGFLTRAEILWEVSGRWRVMAGGCRTFTRSGSMTDTDYGLDNRHDVLYHQEFPVRGGYSEAGSTGIGYAFFEGGRFGFTAYIGYSIGKQYFPVTDPGGPFSSLNSSYAAKWLGPFARLEGSWSIDGSWRLACGVRYDQVVYRGVADWNMIADFAHPVSFRHRADGFGVAGDIRVSYVAGRHWEFGLQGDAFLWETGTGIDELYLATGGVSQTRLNEVVRSGFGGSLGVAWRF